MASTVNASPPRPGVTGGISVAPGSIEVCLERRALSPLRIGAGLHEDRPGTPRLRNRQLQLVIGLDRLTTSNQEAPIGMQSGLHRQAVEPRKQPDRRLILDGWDWKNCHRTSLGAIQEIHEVRRLLDGAPATFRRNCGLEAGNSRAAIG